MISKKTGRIFLKFKLIAIFILISVLHCYAGSLWKQVVSDYAITAIAPYDGGYWFATDASGALQYDLEKGEWRRYNKDNGHMNQSQVVNDMKIMLDKVWFATNYGLYTCNLNGTGWQHHVLPGDYFSNWIRGFDTHSDTVWVAAFTGLYIYSKNSGQFSFFDISIPGNYHTGYTNSVAAGDSMVWIGTDDGIICYNTSLSLTNPASRTYYGKNNGFDTASDLVMCRTVSITDFGVWIGLEEYTPSTSPNYCLGGLFRKFGNQWEKYDKNNGLSANGIHFVHAFGNRVYAGLFHYINGVDYRGAGLLEMDMGTNTMRILNSENWQVSTDNIRALYISGEDTLVGTEEGLFTNKPQIRDMKPYEAPGWYTLRNLGNGDVEITIEPVLLADSYIVYYSEESHIFPDSLIIESSRDTLKNLSQGTFYFFKAAGMNENGAGPVGKDHLICSVSEEENSVLIVYAYYKDIPENTRQYVIQYGESIFSHGYGFDAASAKALSDSTLSLNDYDMVVWIAGMDQESLNDISKPVLANYLESGGKLFISGSHILENISGAGADAHFYNTYLKAVWKKTNTDTYSAIPAEGSIIEDFPAIGFGRGEDTPYQVSRPDGFRPIEGAKPLLLYSGRDSSAYGSAGLTYTGPFGDSEINGSLVYLAFPFETVNPQWIREAMMGRILHYFDFDVIWSHTIDITLPSEFSLKQNYPNPFNPVTFIEYSLPRQTDITLHIYDLQGSLIKEWKISNQSAGYHSIEWNGMNRNGSLVSSGLYIYRLTAGNDSFTRKMVFMK